MQEDEKVERFIKGVKYNIRVEVLKVRAQTLDKCTRVALNIESAIWRAGANSILSTNDGPTPMEVGNIP